MYEAGQKMQHPGLQAHNKVLMFLLKIQVCICFYRYPDPQQVQHCLRQYTIKNSISFFSQYYGEKSLLFISKRKLE